MKTLKPLNLLLMPEVLLLGRIGTPVIPLLGSALAATAAIRARTGVGGVVAVAAGIGT
jgi:hypothetical protein